MDTSEIAGFWISDKDLHPSANTYGLRWMAGDAHGVYYGGPLPVERRDVFWQLVAPVPDRPRKLISKWRCASCGAEMMIYSDGTRQQGGHAADCRWKDAPDEA